MKTIFASSMAGVCLLALAVPAQAQAQTETQAQTTDAPAVGDGTTANADVAEVEQAAPTTAGTDTAIIVTARRRDERIQDVPSVINAVTAEDISRLNFRELGEVQSLAPGLELTSSALGVGGNARLRGVNFDIFSSGNNPTVEFYFNDAPITSGVLLQQMYDIGQIEVLRGPQGTLRGRASPSGSITVTTRKPDLDEFGAFVDITANDIGTQNLQGGFNIPIVPGVAAIRVAGVWDQNEGTRVRSAYRTLDGRDPYSQTWSGRVSALVEPTDWLRFEGLYQKLDRDFRSFDQVESFSEVNPGAVAGPILIRDTDRLSNLEAPRYISQTYDIYNGRAEASLGGQKLIYQFQHYTQDIASTESTDGANLFPGTNVDQTTFTNIKSTSHEVRLQNEERLFGMLDYVIGAFDNKNDVPTDFQRPTIVRLPLAFGGGIAQLVQTPVERTGKSHERSVFGNLTLHIGDKTHVSGGLRYIDFRDNSQLVVGGATLTDVSQKVDKVIYTGSIQHFFTPDVMLYASTGSSFRPGIFVVGDFNLAQSDLEKSFLNLPPETSKSYEVGFKSTLFDRRLRFNLAAYHQTFKNSPYRVPGSGVYYLNTVDAGGGVRAQQVAQFNFTGAVPIEVNGVEGEVAFDITPNWNLSVVGSYSLGKIKNGVVPCTDLNGDGVADSITTAPTVAQLQAATGANNLSACTVSQRSAFLPPFSATVQSEYSIPVSDKLDTFLRGLYSFNGASKGNPTSAFDDVERYGLLNLYAGVRDPEGMWEVTLFAKNVLSTDKVLSRTDPLSTSYQQLPGAIINGVPTITGRPAGVTFTSGYTGITTTQPREFGLNFKYRFGSR